MNTELIRVYKAIVWMGDLPGERVEVTARNLAEASAVIQERFGAEAVVSLCNEEDSNAPR